MRHIFIAAAVTACSPFLMAQPSATRGATTPSLSSPTQPAAPATAAAMQVPRVHLIAPRTGANLNAERDQSIEMRKDFERDCPAVKMTSSHAAADYFVLLKPVEMGVFIRDNQVQVADRNGHLIASRKEDTNIAAAVHDACDAIMADCNKK